MSKEQVNHPEHYGGKDNPYETIKIIDAMGWGKEFCLGNVIKYVTRAGKKDNNSSKQDLNKAKWYLEHAIELIEKEKTNKSVKARNDLNMIVSKHFNRFVPIYDKHVCSCCGKPLKLD